MRLFSRYSLADSSNADGFNPCCSGLVGETLSVSPVGCMLQCFNPCCSGLVGETQTTTRCLSSHTRRKCFNPCCSGLVGETPQAQTIVLQWFFVSILVVVDWSVRLSYLPLALSSTLKCFNPCCSGLVGETRKGLKCKSTGKPFQSLL